MSTAPSTRSNRHSLNIHPSSGPRPLQLVNGITLITSPTKATSAVTNTISTSTRSHVHADRRSATHSSQNTSGTPSNANLRRHSSIPYKSSSYDHCIPTNSENDVPPMQFQRKSRPKSLMFSPHPNLPSHLVVAASSPLARDSSDSRDWSFDPGFGAGSTGASTPAEERERRPLTLVEKHADLLRFIAQKESKCLELRSQLATHEVELVQLKRKWERIVSRSFESPLAPPGSTLPSPLLPSESTSPSTTITIPAVPIQTGAVFEGIKEGVQGVSRLIVSGLSASGDHHHYHNYNLASPLSLHSQSRSSTTQKPRPHSLYSQYPSTITPSHTRSTNLSGSSNVTSSTSTSSSADSVTTPTTASAGARFSVASFDSSSSFEENATTLPTEIRETCSLATRDANVAEDAELSANSSIDSWSSSELIVRDTGATPMMSPNPKFKFAAERRQRENEKASFSKTNDKKNVELETEKNEEEVIVTTGSKDDNSEVVSPGMGNSSAISRSNSYSRCHRRKSRDVSGLVPSSSPALDDFSDSPPLDLNSNSTPPISEPSQQTRSRSTLSPSLISLPIAGSTATNSLAGAFAPASTISGLSLAESAAMLMTGACGSSGEVSSPSHSVRMEMENEACRASTYQQVLQAQQHPPSSWVGKKWDKWTQKRASGLLSDVSQTLAYAFSLSTTNSTTHPTPHSTPSILDLDDDWVSSTMMDEPMKPTIVVSPRTADIGDMLGQGRKLRTKVQNEDESEWNW